MWLTDWFIDRFKIFVLMHSSWALSHTHTNTRAHSLDHPWLSCNSVGLQQFRQETLHRENYPVTGGGKVTLFNFCHSSHKGGVLPCAFVLSLRLKLDLTYVSWPANSIRKRRGKKTNWTNALKWKIWSFHLPPLLFARLLLQSRSAEEQMFSQTWRRGASVLMGMPLPPLTADASTWQLLDFMELLRSH